MRDKGLIFDLEDILISYNLDTKAEADLILDFLLQRKYIFQSDDLEGLTPSEFIAEFSGWRGKDREILDNEISASSLIFCSGRSWGQRCFAGVVRKVLNSRDIPQ